MARVDGRIRWPRSPTIQSAASRTIGITGISKSQIMRRSYRWYRVNANERWEKREPSARPPVRPIPASLVQMVFLPMKKVADAGIPIFIVPGNHERSRIPYDMLALHPRIFVFDRPRTFVENVNGTTVALAGFPYWRNKVRTEFPRILEATEWHTKSADVNLLCVHHCFEGAIVGPHNYVFRYGSDVIRLEDVPIQFAAVLT
jgi:hypothetical protein